MTRDHAWVFVGEVGAEFVIEIIFSLLIIPIIRKHTVLKEFNPTSAAKGTIKVEIVYLAFLSIITYPLMLFMILY